MCTLILSVRCIHVFLCLQRVPFSSPILSLIKTMTMTEGEFDFDNNFALVPGANVSRITYPITSFTLWIIFLILMSILLTNLLVSYIHECSCMVNFSFLCILQTGLAVDDVKAIQDNAKLKRLELKVSTEWIQPGKIEVCPWIWC